MANLSCAIDLGTSGVKVALVDEDGHIVASSVATYDIDTPEEGWAETSPASWMRAIEQAFRAVRSQTGEPIVAVGIDGQMHGLVLGRGNEPVRPALLWPDSRATDQVERWTRLPADLLARLANPVVPGMLGPMLGWLAEHEPRVVGEAEYVCSPKDWVRRQLCPEGDMVTDPSDASATLAWDVTTATWHHELLDALALPGHLFVDVVDSAQSTVTGTGSFLPGGVPMSVGCADTAATLLASQLQAGEVLVNIGTGIQVCMGATEPRADAAPTSHTYMDARGEWYSMVAPQNGGLALGKVRELLGAGWSELYDSLDFTPSVGTAVMFQPWFASERLPTFSSGDRAGWTGLGLGTTRAELMRAALESVAFQVARTISSLPSTPEVIRFSGGGTREPRMRQLICDATGLPARSSTVSDATALGAGKLGFHAAGLDPQWPIPRETRLMQPRRDPALAGRYEAFLLGVSAV